MTTMTKRLLLGAGGSFLLIVLLAIVNWLAFGNAETGTGPDAVWAISTLLELATVALLIGAGISFLVGRTRKAS